MFHFDRLYLLVFLPVVLIIYSLFKPKYRKYVLLAASYFLFYSISKKLIIYILLSTLSIHHLGIWLENIELKKSKAFESVDKEEKKTIKEKYQKEKKRVLLFGVVLHIGLLLVLKYSPFFATNINSLLHFLNIKYTICVPKFVLPIGISFYTLMAVSYMVDVYRGKINAENNIIKLALFLSFFPYLIEGPIVKYDDCSDTLFEGNKLDYKNVTFGAQRIAYGVMKKIVVADRLNLLIKMIFSNYLEFSGSVVFLAAICYTIQLYMEFSGTMDVAIGSAEMFGIKLPENFNAPFFSKTISEFWQRWHITLGRWFKDYIYYPLSLSKPLKKVMNFGRKHLGNYYGPLLSGTVALLAVWFSNGLWHGAAWKYIFFGLYHFTLILLNNLLEPLKRIICAKLKINRQSKLYRIVQIIIVFNLVVIGEMFFRADTLNDGFRMLGLILTNFNFKNIIDGTFLTLGLDLCDYIIVLVTLLIVFAISLMREKEISIREHIAKKPIIVRWVIYYVFIMFILIFGAYGANYVPIGPIYAEF